VRVSTVIRLADSGGVSCRVNAVSLLLERNLLAGLEKVLVCFTLHL
jgi:hypothetical protein